MDKTMIMGLSSPWFFFHKEVQALFGRDSEVHVKDLADLGEGKFGFLILVSNLAKAQAIKAILPQTVPLGNITISITVLGPDEDDINCSEVPVVELYNTAFSGNPIFEQTLSKSICGMTFNYCIFKKEVIQFWNDDLSDYCGNYNGLATDIAKEVLTPCNMQYCISVK